MNVAGATYISECPPTHGTAATYSGPRAPRLVGASGMQLVGQNPLPLPYLKACFKHTASLPLPFATI